MLLGFAVFRCDGRANPAPNVPIALDLGPPRRDSGNKIVQDAVGDILVECPFVPVGPQVELERFKFDAQLIRDVFDNEMRKIRLAGERTDAGELRSVESDDIVAIGVRIGKRVEVL